MSAAFQYRQGRVSTRDFLIGLAIIQAFPGPNFNFAVYWGALAVLGTPHSTVVGAFLGFVFTAVYRLWEIGYLSQESSSGQSLDQDPWWVVVTTLTDTGNAWFTVPAPVAIVTGGLVGLCWYGAVGR